VATMATLGVRSRSLERSLALEIPLNHAPSANRSEQPRTTAQNRQAGGHWFEPSTAHLKSPRTRGGFAFSGGNAAKAVAAKCPHTCQAGALSPARRSSKGLVDATLSEPCLSNGTCRSGSSRTSVCPNSRRFAHRPRLSASADRGVETRVRHRLSDQTGRTPKGDGRRAAGRYGRKAITNRTEKLEAFTAAPRRDVGGPLHNRQGIAGRLSGSRR
jgi:hypothetical protein